MQEKQKSKPSIPGGFSFIRSVTMDREDFLRIAMRYDTVMSRAMLRALGAERPAKRGAVAAKVDRYAGARRLMAQKTGVRM